MSKKRVRLSNPETDIKPVLHEMLMLSQAIRYMKGLPCDVKNRKFGLPSTAQIAAVNSCRSLLRFLFDSDDPPAALSGQKQGKRALADDIILEDWVKLGKCNSVPANQAIKDTIALFDKFVSHLTMTRTSKPRSGSRPTHRIVKQTGRKVLQLCQTVIEECFANGVPKRGEIKRYYDALQDENKMQAGG